MCKFFLCSFGVLILFSINVHAQDIFIKFKDGSTVTYSSSEIEKITFGGGGKKTFISAKAKWEGGKSTSPHNAIDGDTSTVYQSLGTHNFGHDGNMWWEGDLGSIQSISKIRVFWHKLPSQYWKEIEIDGSRDGRNYSTIVSRSSVNIDGSWTNFNAPGNCRFVRVKYVGSGSGGHGMDLNEIEVY